jgi:putative phage-type endonuclease
MKIIKLEQKSPEWLAWREEGIGGSEIASVVGLNPYQTEQQLYELKAKLKPAEDLSKNFHIKRGNRLEPMARKMVNGELNADFEEICFEHDSLSWARYSSDGVSFTREEIIEIKGMGDKNHQMILDLKPNWKFHELDAKHPLKYYMPQMQYGMAITGFKKCHFISYNPGHPMPYKRVEVDADKDLQDFILIQGGQFWKRVLEKQPPEVLSKDEKLDDLVRSYKLNAEAKKKAEAFMEEIKKEIMEHTKGKDIKTEKSNVFFTPRKGAIDYEAIPALKGLDLEQYRKQPIQILNIK